jgi:hypothetical protein
MARFKSQTDDYLLAFGTTPRQMIRITGGFFTTSPGSIRAAAEFASRLAREHSISVVQEDEKF